MQNLSAYGVTELDSTEMMDVEGGIIPLIIAAIVIIALTPTPAY
jgi:lactobin A/cerein 7B family class IIb bacteriocin